MPGEMRNGEGLGLASVKEDKGQVGEGRELSEGGVKMQQRSSSILLTL